MIQVIANHPQHGKIVRVTKTRARNLFNAGKNFLVICANCHPIGPEQPALVEPVRFKQEGWDFDRYVKNYEYYNCVDTQTGRRAGYYEIIAA